MGCSAAVKMCFSQVRYRYLPHKAAHTGAAFVFAGYGLEPAIASLRTIFSFRGFPAQSDKRLNQKTRRFSRMSVFADNLKSTRVIFPCYFTIIPLLGLAIPYIVCYNKMNCSIRKIITERGLTKMKNSTTILSLDQSRVTLPASFVNTFLKKINRRDTLA